MSCTCNPSYAQSCTWCDGTAADDLDAVTDVYGPTGEACTGLGDDGHGCPRRAEDGTPWCPGCSVLAVDRLTLPIGVAA